MRLPRLSLLRAVLIGCCLALAAPVAPIARPAAAHPAPDGFADLAARLLPAVVNVSSTETITLRGGAGPDLPVFPPGSPFEKLFKDFLNKHHPGEAPPVQRRAQSLGSGFIIDPAGYIVTNNHVIAGADSVSVTLQDGTKLKAKIVGRDKVGDLALLKVDAGKPLPTVPFGDSSKARVGDWVIAIGNPFGLGGTVTAGIVSARGRDIHQGEYDDFLQTDAAINRGNSGGPLFNMQGEVIGINTAIFSPSGGSIGIGFAIPANMAKRVIDQIRKYGHARRGWLGVKIQDVTPDIAESLGLKAPTGAMVAGLTKGGPAEKALLRPGDIILKFNDVDVKAMHNLPRIVADTEVGKTVPVVVWRDGKDVTLNVTLAERPSDKELAEAEAGKPVDLTRPTPVEGLGLEISPITQELQQKYHLSETQKGVVVTEVSPNGAAAEHGLQDGDVILEVQQTQVMKPADVTGQVEDARKAGRKNVLMRVRRGSSEQFVALSLAQPKPEPKQKQGD